MAETLKGFTCETCNKWHKFPAYVYAHTRVLLTHSCDNCGAKHGIVMLHAGQTKKGRLTKKNREHLNAASRPEEKP